MLRPWNEPRKAMIPKRFEWYFASLIIASTASVPELAKNVRTPPVIGTISAMTSASRTCGS